MRRQISTRSYTNFILTAIAVLLLALTIHAYQLSFTGSAYAQDSSIYKPGSGPGRGFAKAGAQGPDEVNSPIQGDTAVAAATNNVAAANREVAAAIRQLSDALQGMAPALASKQGTAGPGASNSSAPETTVDVKPGR